MASVGTDAVRAPRLEYAWASGALCALRRQMQSSRIVVEDPPLAYSQCWEDPAVLRAALRPGPDDDVLSICGAGDNAFALLGDDVRSVTCVDQSASQLAGAEFKLHAARLLPVESFRSALGLDALGRRVWFYHHVRPALGPRARGFLDGHEDLIREKWGDRVFEDYDRYLGLCPKAFKKHWSGDVQFKLRRI